MIILKMRSKESARSVMRITFKLKRTRISILKDLPYNIRQCRAKMIPIVKELRQKDLSIKISLRYDKLHIAKKVFTRDSALGLRCGEKSGIEINQSIFDEISLNKNLYINVNKGTNKTAEKENTSHKNSNLTAQIPRCEKSLSPPSSSKAAVRDV